MIWGPNKSDLICFLRERREISGLRVSQASSNYRILHVLTMDRRPRGMDLERLFTEGPNPYGRTGRKKCEKCRFHRVKVRFHAGASVNLRANLMRLKRTCRVNDASLSDMPAPRRPSGRKVESAQKRSRVRSLHNPRHRCSGRSTFTTFRSELSSRFHRDPLPPRVWRGYSIFRC